MSRVHRGWKRTLGPLEEQQVLSRGELSPHLWTPLLLKQMQRIRESTATFGKDYTGIPPQKSLSTSSQDQQLLMPGFMRTLEWRYPNPPGL